MVVMLSGMIAFAVFRIFCPERTVCRECQRAADAVHHDDSENMEHVDESVDRGRVRA
jgi:hypothetical protein